MSDIFYVREKLGSAVAALATGTGTIGERLDAAREHIARADRGAFTSPRAHEMYDELMAGLAAADLSKPQAVTLARLTVELYDEATAQASRRGDQ